MADLRKCGSTLTMRLVLFAVVLTLLLHVHNATDLANSTQEVLGTAAVQEEAEVLASTVSLESAFKGFKGDDNKFEKVDEQTRVDTLVRALKRLPERELSHYGLTSSDLEQSYTPGTKETDKLFAAWNVRQDELKKAVDSMMKPAEYMQDLVKFVIPSYPGREAKKESSDDEGKLVLKEFVNRVDALEQLENLVEDIDNARDFNTVGGFRAITKALIVPPSGDPEYSLEERSLAAAVIGNAVKNDYDFQLWVLEEEAECLRGLLSMLCSEGDDIARRRALYALASASRGNSDVQEHILDITESGGDLSACLMELLEAFVASAEEEGVGAQVSVELSRKALAFISDMLSEYSFLQQQIKNPQGLEIEVGADGSMGDAAMAGELMSQLHAIRPLGPAFCSEDWKVLSIRTLDKASALLLSATEETTSSSDKGDKEGKKDGWMRALLSSVRGKTGFKAGRPDGEDEAQRSARGLLSSRRGALENALSVFLESSEVCEPVGHTYSSTVGAEHGPGAVVAAAKGKLEQVQAWASAAGDAAGELSDRLSQSLQYFD